MEEAADTDIMEDMYRGYETLTDEEILLDIKEHNNKVALDYLINKYRNFVRAKARSYFLIGADREDIVQEGMIGFYKAIRDFRDDKLSSFRAFAEALRDASDHHSNQDGDPPETHPAQFVCLAQQADLR